MVSFRGVVADFAPERQRGRGNRTGSAGGNEAKREATRENAREGNPAAGLRPGPLHVRRAWQIWGVSKSEGNVG